jgi:hypothetical protein
MKIWSNGVLITICIFLAVGGCRSVEKAEASKPVTEKKAAASEQAAQTAPKSSATISEPAPQPGAALTPAVSKGAASTEPNKPVGQQPEIKFQSTVYDLNEVKPDSKNMATFTFTNAGKGDLKIIDIQKTCGCTVPQLEKNDYMPGESGTIKVEYHSSKFGGPVVKHLYGQHSRARGSRAEIYSAFTRSAGCKCAGDNVNQQK